MAAQVGRERINEIEDPEIGIDRLMETYLRKGYSKDFWFFKTDLIILKP